MARKGMFGMMAVALIALIVELARPSTVMYPLRRLADRIGIKLAIPEITPELNKQTRKDAAAWKALALAEFPNLAITPHPVPDEENGFLQLYLLDGRHQPSAELVKLLGTWKDFDADQARAALAADSVWVEHIEWISGLQQRSGIKLPDGYNGFFPARPTKQAMDTLLLKAMVAVDAADETEALRCVSAVGNLIDHLQHVETPTLLTETVGLLAHLGRAGFIMEQALPRIGRSANLEQWRRELERSVVNPKRLAHALRGEWHTGCDYLTYQWIAAIHRERMLPDPEKVAMAYAEAISRQTARLEEASLDEMAGHLSHLNHGQKLSRAGRELMDVLSIGTTSWEKGYIRIARIDACHRAVFDLLQREASEGQLAADDARHVTLDPLTGEPFVFDAAARTLVLADAPGQHQEDKPLKLPW